MTYSKDEVQEVINIMKRIYPEMVDYNVEDDDCVNILDKDSNVIDVITSDELTNYWNQMEGVVLTPFFVNMGR